MVPKLSFRCPDAISNFLSCGSQRHSFIFNDFFLPIDTNEKLVYSDDPGLLTQIQTKLLNLEANIEDFKNYGSGSKDLVSLAISNPEDTELNKQARDLLSHLLSKIVRYYDAGQRMKPLIYSILFPICSDPLSTAEALVRHRPLIIQFCRIIDFVFQFDAMKLTTTIPNDLSFYRRMNSNDAQDLNVYSFFFASSHPMLDLLVDFTQTFVKESGLARENVADTLSALLNALRNNIFEQENEPQPSEQKSFISRVMVGCFILLDHIDPDGIWHSASPIDIPAIVEALKTNHTEGPILINAMRFSCSPQKFIRAPEKIRALFP